MGKNIQNNYAKQDGYYQGLTAGLADNLNSRMTLNDKSPYVFRSAGGSLEVGNACYLKSITGGTFVFNQMLPVSSVASTTKTGVTFTNNGDGSWNITTGNGTATDNAYLVILNNDGLKFKSSHKYLLKGNMGHGSSTTFYLSDNYDGAYRHQDYGDGVIIGNTGNVSSFSIAIRVLNGTAVDNVKIIPQLFDLTQMFGKSIANYIYSLEQGTAGAGVAWFKRFFPKNYYAYNSGSLINVRTNGKTVVGFNAYNPSTGYAKLLGGREYQISGSYSVLAYQDVNGDSGTFYPDADGKFTPDNDCRVLISDGNAEDTCVHLVWDGERDGDFEPYSETIYPISYTELNGLPKLDGENNLYYDGDEYKSNGTVVTRYGVKTLSSNYAVGDSITVSDLKSDTAEIICNKYGELSEWGTVSGTTITLTKSLKTNDTIIYKLANETTDVLNGFTEKQLVNNWGTETFLNSQTIPVPVGNDTDYLPDLKAKLEVVPESPTTDGYYVIKRDSGENSYSLLNSWLSANGYVKKEEIALTNVGTITATEIVSGSLYRNDIAVSGGVDAEDVIFIKTSDSVVYPTLNMNGTTLTVFCATNLSSISVSKMWKL